MALFFISIIWKLNTGNVFYIGASFEVFQRISRIYELDYL